MLNFVIKYWVEVGFGLILSGVGFLLSFSMKSIKAEFIEQEELKKAILALLEDQIYKKSMYFIKKTVISFDEMQNLGKMYKQYEVLGGNGAAKTLYERCLRLEVVAKEDMK